MHQPLTAPRPNEPGADLIQYGWTERVAARLRPLLDGGLIPGRVVRVDKGGSVVAIARGIERCAVPPAHRPDPPVTGDWVAMADEPGLGLRLESIVPRRTAVRRANPMDTGSQTLAANIDVVLLLFGVDRPLKPGRIERFMTVAWSSGARPVVVLTKIDLAGDPHDVDCLVADAADAAPGVEVVPLSPVTGEGVDGLASHLEPGTTLALLGESGAGKTTLVNHLAGSSLVTGRTRTGDSKGRHTTTARELVPTPSGVVLIDTPGLRAVAIADEEEGLGTVFPEVEALADECRFRDCTHRHEPGCAVLAAVESGEVTERRLRSYRSLQREVAHQIRRAEHRQRIESRRRRVRPAEAIDVDWGD